MRLKDLRVNHVTEPLGLAIERPVFSWVAEDTESKKQAAAPNHRDGGRGDRLRQRQAGGHVLPGV